MARIIPIFYLSFLIIKRMERSADTSVQYKDLFSSFAILMGLLAMRKQYKHTNYNPP